LLPEQEKNSTREWIGAAFGSIAALVLGAMDRLGLFQSRCNRAQAGTHPFERPRNIPGPVRALERDRGTAKSPLLMRSAWLTKSATAAQWAQHPGEYPEHQRSVKKTASPDHGNQMISDPNAKDQANDYRSD
jgi:hypothetical protein